MNTKLYFVRALSPIHCGTGQAIGAVDLPIARERPTGMPLIPGSSLKGVLRASEVKDKDLHLAVFGPDTDKASEHAGAVQFSDANLLFLPMRSVRGTFAWVTSPYLIRRFQRDAQEAGLKLPKLPSEPNANGCLVTSERLVTNNKVVLDDFDLTAEKKPEWKNWCDEVANKLFDPDEKPRFLDRACLVHEDVMGIFAQTGMELMARNRLNPETHTVDKGALWTEEALPVESILAGIMVATVVPRLKKEPAALLGYVKDLASGAIQIGGKATVGRGFCELRVG